MDPSWRKKRRTRNTSFEKMSEYAAFGIRYYWLVDPSARVLEIYELEDGGLYRRALGAADGNIDTVPGCAGLSLNLDELWSEVALLEMDS